MNKLKSTFSKSNKPNQQTITKPFNDETYSTTPTTPAIPQLKLSALAQHERLQYFSWWKDLDPFNIGVLDNQSVLHFLKGCHITDDVLEKVMTNSLTKMTAYASSFNWFMQTIRYCDCLIPLRMV